MPPLDPPLLILTALSLSAVALWAQPRLITETSFEAATVLGASPEQSGGRPTESTSTQGQPALWETFENQPKLGAEYGAITAGLTNRTARTGTQCLFVQAANLDAPYIGVQWASRPIAIEPSRYYRITLWGRDGTRQAAAGTTSPAPLYLNIHVCFYEREEHCETAETGEALYLVVPLQNAAGHTPRLSAEKWTPLEFEFEAPEKAAFFRVSFQCGGRASKGPINATVYFDDFRVTEEPLPAQETTLAGNPTLKLHRLIHTNRHQKRFICLPLAENQAK